MKNMLGFMSCESEIERDIEKDIEKDIEIEIEREKSTQCTRLTD